MSKYKTAIIVKREDIELTVVPYVKAQCGETENIGFIVTKSDSGVRCHGKICDEMNEVMQMIENMIYDSVLED